MAASGTSNGSIRQAITSAFAHSGLETVSSNMHSWTNGKRGIPRRFIIAQLLKLILYSSPKLRKTHSEMKYSSLTVNHTIQMEHFTQLWRIMRFGTQPKERKYLFSISVRYGDAGDAVASPTLENWPLFGQKCSAFGKIIQLHPYLSEVVSILPSMAKPLLRLFCHSFLLLMAK